MSMETSKTEKEKKRNIISKKFGTAPKYVSYT